MLKALFLVTNDWYFCSHRLPLARRLRDAGAEVFVMTRLNHNEEDLRGEGFRVLSWHIASGSLNPFREMFALWEVIRVYRKVQPNLVHHIALKPVVYGGLAARFCGGISSVNVIAGLGHVFASQSRRMRVLRRVLLALFRYVLQGKNTVTIFQNEENRDYLIKIRAVRKEHSLVIRGSGVNVQEFSPHPEPGGVPVVVLVSRMLWDKGVGDFVMAAEILRSQSISARFVLVGDPDPGNPACIRVAQLRAWAGSGAVEWWGYQKDMPAAFAQSSIVCLPSYYGEGVPKVLIEAAACGRAIVTSDIPGCREVVRDGVNGLLVPMRDPEALARALKILLEDPARRASMGTRGREIAVREFSEELVINQTMATYRDLLGSQWTNTLQEQIF
jgi:glycosyltransferase involved in cell wall biosynthesis